MIFIFCLQHNEHYTPTLAISPRRTIGQSNSGIVDVRHHGGQVDAADGYGFNSSNTVLNSVGTQDVLYQKVLVSSNGPGGLACLYTPVNVWFPSGVWKTMHRLSVWYKPVTMSLSDDTSNIVEKKSLKLKNIGHKEQYHQSKDNLLTLFSQFHSVYKKANTHPVDNWVF